MDIAFFLLLSGIFIESNIMLLKWIKVLEGLLHLDLVKIGSKLKGKVIFEEQFLKATLPTVKISSFRECHLSNKFLNIKDNCPQRVLFVPKL